MGLKLKNSLPIALTGSASLTRGLKVGTYPHL